MRILHINSYYAQGVFYKNLYDEQIRRNMAIDVYVPTPVPVSRDLGTYTRISLNHKKVDRYIFYVKHMNCVIIQLFMPIHCSPMAMLRCESSGILGFPI